jgi:hypothetical protein
MKINLADKLAKPLENVENPIRLILGVVIAALVLGTLTGYIISTKKSNTSQQPT